MILKNIHAYYRSQIALKTHDCFYCLLIIIDSLCVNWIYDSQIRFLCWVAIFYANFQICTFIFGNRFGIRFSTWFSQLKQTNSHISFTHLILLQWGLIAKQADSVADRLSRLTYHVICRLPLIMFVAEMASKRQSFPNKLSSPLVFVHFTPYHTTTHVTKLIRHFFLVLIFNIPNWINLLRVFASIVCKSLSKFVVFDARIIITNVSEIFVLVS